LVRGSGENCRGKESTFHSLHFIEKEGQGRDASWRRGNLGDVKSSASKKRSNRIHVLVGEPVNQVGICRGKIEGLASSVAEEGENRNVSNSEATKNKKNLKKSDRPLVKQNGMAEGPLF